MLKYAFVSITKRWRPTKNWEVSTCYYSLNGPRKWTAGIEIQKHGIWIKFLVRGVSLTWLPTFDEEMADFLGDVEPEDAEIRKRLNKIGLD